MSAGTGQGTRDLRIVVTGLGGQGSIVATRILGEAAMATGIRASMGEVHGMSQRGGVVETTLCLGECRSPVVPPGGADVLLAFEPDEALRRIDRCSRATVAIVNTRRVIPVSVSTGAASYVEPARVLELFGKVAGRVVALDATEVAESWGTHRAMNAVMLGALMGCCRLPFGDDAVVEAMRRFVPPRFVDQNVRAFLAGRRAVTGG